MGDGMANSQYIYDTYGPAGSDTLSSYPVFQACYGYTLGSYSDWFLPSQDELWQMCWNLYGLKWESVTVQNPDVPVGGVGGFADSAAYWSSSELNVYTASAQGFGSGAQGDPTKNFDFYRVRAF